MAKGFADLPAGAQAGVVAGLIVAGLGAVLYYYVWPMNAEIATLKTKTLALRAENDKNEVFRRQQTEYLNRIAELTKKLETLRTIVPDEAKTDEFVIMVYDSGRSAGTWIRTFTALAPIVHDFYVELPFTVHVDAAYYSLLTFFDRLAHAQRIASVNGLALGAAKGGGGFTLSPNESVDANFTLTTYYNKPSAPATPPAPKR